MAHVGEDYAGDDMAGVGPQRLELGTLNFRRKARRLGLASNSYFTDRAEENEKSKNHIATPKI